MPKGNEYYTCLSVILLDSILVNSDKECFPQIFLEECKYMMKNRELMNTINEGLVLSKYNDDESDNESDETN